MTMASSAAGPAGPRHSPATPSRQSNVNRPEDARGPPGEETTMPVPRSDQSAEPLMITTTHGRHAQPLARDVPHLGPILPACPVCGAMQYWHNHRTEVWECWGCVPPPTTKGIL
jgi:hypothetical protein